MSFLERAKSAASQVADQARQTADQLTDRATDPETQARLKSQVGGGMRFAGRRMRTAIERIDPGTLAELIIKATAVQEMTNRALRERGSPYRIAEIGIAATIPPGVNFSIARVGDEDTSGTHASTELLAAEGQTDQIATLGGAAELSELAELAEEELAQAEASDA